MNSSLFRLTVFLSLLCILGGAEWFWPRHDTRPQRLRRWPINLGLGALDTLCLRLLMPWVAFDAANWAQAHQFGALHLLRVPSIPAAAFSFVALDLIIYAQHRLMHSMGVLWRLHRVHHTDRALDVSAGVRFHPAEILLSMGIKIGVVIMLGAPAEAVLAFELVLSSFALFTHANIALPEGVDRVLRAIFITPDMHRIHHSIFREERDSNYGFHVSWWDRMFGSYTARPQHSQTRMELGLTTYRADSEQRFLALLRQPLDAP